MESHADADTGAFRLARVTANRGVRWLVAGLLIAASLVQIFSLTPLPLDAPHTLRPLVYTAFAAFVRLNGTPEQALGAWRTLCLAALLSLAGLSIINVLIAREELRLPRAVTVWLTSRGFFWTTVVATLVVCRYPGLMAGEINPDEGQFIAAAHKLFYDPNFFRSVDVGTSGPVNIFPLMAPAIFGLSPDFASTRAIALILLLLITWLLYRTFALVADEAVARVVAAFAAGWFATLRTGDLVIYNSETVPLVLVAAALYFAVSLLRDPRNAARRVIALGLLTGAAFLAKMQAVPIVVAISAVAIARVFLARQAGAIRLAAWFTIGAAPLLAAVAIVCLASGVWGDVWFSYVEANRYYQSGDGSQIDLPVFTRFVVDTPDMRYFLTAFLGIAAAYQYARGRRRHINDWTAFLSMAVVSAAAMAGLTFLHMAPGVANYSPLLFLALLVAPMALLLFLARGTAGMDPASWLGVLIVLVTPVSLFAIYEAHRLFPHYLMFLFVPVSAAVGWMLTRMSDAPADTPRHTSAFVCLVAALGLSYQIGLMGLHRDAEITEVRRTIRPPEGDYVRALGNRTGPIAVWGWTSRPYLGSGRVAATRDTNMANFFRPWPEVNQFYRARFLREMQQHPAEVFVDAVGPTSIVLTDPALYGFEQVPSLAEFINANYVHVADRYGQRYFVRRDLPMPEGAK